MTVAYIVGAAMIPMKKYPSSSYPGLGAPPIRASIRGSGITASQIQEAFCGHSFGGMLTGQRVLKTLGIGDVPVTNVEDACSGGAVALHAAVNSIREGRADVALVVGIDKLSQFGGGTLPLSRDDAEVCQGIVMPAVYAMRARRLMYERGVTAVDLALVSVKARRHGALNPYAQYRKEVTVDEVLASRPIADPLTLLQCCPTSDGAAAIIVVSDEVRKRLARPTVAVRASVLHSGRFLSGFRDMLTPKISQSSAQEAYEEAGVGPESLNVVELHDAFSVAELIYYEALGLCGEGDAVQLLRSGQTTFGGKVVVNPSGGLLSKGHPVGASGVAQVVEAFWQLTGQAHRRQVLGARVALTHVTGGGLSGLDHGACTVHILERVD